MKLTLIKSTLVTLGKGEFQFGLIIMILPRLSQMEQDNGSLFSHYHMSAWNHFGLRTILLVSEDHEMTC